MSDPTLDDNFVISTTGVTMSLSRNFERIAVCLVAVASLAACGEDESEEQEQIEITTDAADRDVDEVDAGSTGDDVGSAPDTSDAGDASADTGEVVREIVDRGLFGEMPVDNYVLDPSFRSVRNWLSYELEGQQPSGFVRTDREVYPETPMDAAVMQVPATDGGAQLQVIGTLMFRPAPMEVSIWVGGDEGDDRSADIRVAGVQSDQPAEVKTVQLEAEPSTTQVVGDLQWTQYSASVTGLFGSGYMLISASGDNTLYFHAPVATKEGESVNALRLPPSPLEPASTLDLNSIRRARQWQRNHRPDPKDQMFRPTPEPLEGFTQ
jgi:hypothetical protein